MKHISLVIFILCSLSAIHGQPKSVFDLLQENQITHITLTLPWKELEKKKSDKRYLSAQLTIESVEKTKTLPLSIRTRGNMRLGICTYPPLKLKFDKVILANEGLSDNNEMDLVHHCHDDELYEQLILREYLAYQLYREINPVSFETQLVKIHYQNPDGTEAHEPTTGFVVENCEELVSRLEGKRNKTATMSQNAIDRSTFLQTCLFQYMIGNTDWNVKNRHNLEFIQVPGYDFLVPVPFDFDYSGLVSAPYAVHHESINLPSVTSRFYQGRCVSRVEMAKAIQVFLSKKEKLLAICHEIPGFSERSLKHVTSYLTEFFDILENPKKTENYIINQCDRWPRE